MTGRWWECKTCLADLGIFGELVMDHVEQVGHVGAVLRHGERGVLDRPIVPRRTLRYTADGDPL